jgi:hypothetical protein
MNGKIKNKEKKMIRMGENGMKRKETIEMETEWGRMLTRKDRFTSVFLNLFLNAAHYFLS